MMIGEPEHSRKHKSEPADQCSVFSAGSGLRGAHPLCTMLSYRSGLLNDRGRPCGPGVVGAPEPVSEHGDLMGDTQPDYGYSTMCEQDAPIFFVFSSVYFPNDNGQYIQRCQTILEY